MSVKGCTPSCASGGSRTYRAKVVVDQPTVAGDRTYFARLRLHFLGASPRSLVDVTCQLSVGTGEAGGCDEDAF